MIRGVKVATQPEAILAALTRDALADERIGLYRPVHVKTPASQKQRMLLTSNRRSSLKVLDTNTPR